MAADPVPSPTPSTTGAEPSEGWLLARSPRSRDPAAREELVRRMMPLVRRVATSYGARGHGDDLEQVASLGLFKAIERYDPAFGVPLRTYAIPTMFGEVRRYLRDTRGPAGGRAPCQSAVWEPPRPAGRPAPAPG